MTFARTAAKLLARAMVRALRLISACALEVATRLHNAATTCDGRASVFVVTAAAQGVHHRFITEAFEVHTISTTVLPATFHESEMRCIALKRMLTFMYHARQFSEECSPAVCTAVSQAIDHLPTVTRYCSKIRGNDAHTSWHAQPTIITQKGFARWHGWHVLVKTWFTCTAHCLPTASRACTRTTPPS